MCVTGQGAKSSGLWTKLKMCILSYALSFAICGILTQNIRLSFMIIIIYGNFVSSHTIQKYFRSIGFMLQ